MVPWCNNTPDWWWKDMSKLVWRENSPYSISLHLVHEYVIRSHRYKTGTLDWGSKSSGPQFSCHQLSDQPQIWQVDIFSHGCLAGQLQLAGWLTGYPTKCQPDLPRQSHLVAKCVTTSLRLTFGQMYPSRQWHLVAKCVTTLGQVDLWSDVPSPGRDILWPSVILLQVRLTCLLEGKSGASCQSNSSSISVN